jgi:magnesium chelatase family protein
MTTKNLAMVYSAELEGINAKLIEVEVDLNVGIHAFNIVGLADKSLNEARERVNSALKNSGMRPPNRENRKITINLAPADIKKTGSQYDLAIALGYLMASAQIHKFETGDKIFLGELALDGRLRAINGALNVAEIAGERGFEYLFLPRENAGEAAAIKNIKIVPVESLQEIIELLEGRKVITPTALTMVAQREVVGDVAASGANSAPDFSEIIGQESAKRALTIAAAGGHNVLMTGFPGVGKSFLAKAFAGILPDLALEEAIEATKIWSAAGLRPDGLIRERPFRAPHQTASTMALIGGGAELKPGEISLAHRGVLFLDELPEFQKSALEALREPIESGTIQIARAKGTLTFPAKFTLVAAMNPCPCGYYGDDVRHCKCSAYEVIRYQKKISGPLLDRIDLQVKVGRIKIADLRSGGRDSSSGAGGSGDGGGAKGELRNAAIKKAVECARGVQRERFGGVRAKTNSEMDSREVDRLINFGRNAERFLKTIDRSNLSPRGYYRLLKVARTIADLAGEEQVTADYLAEAFGYRLRDEL